MIRPGSLLAVLAVMVPMAPAPVGVGVSSPPPAAAHSPRTMSVTDVVEVRHVQETQTSPDGRRVAVVVTEPSVASNAVTSRVLVVDLATAGDARTITTETHRTSRITNLRWVPDGRSLLFLSARNGADQVWKVPAAGGRPRLLFDSDNPPAPVGGSEAPFGAASVPPHLVKVLAFELSPDGRALAWTSPQARPAGDAAQGVAYDDQTMTGHMIRTGRFDIYDLRLWLRDVRTGATRVVADLPVARGSGGEGGMAWSPNGTKLALLRLASRAQDRGGYAHELHVVDRASGRPSRVITENLLPSPPVWSPEGELILGGSGGSLVGLPVAGGEPVPLVTVPDRLTGVLDAWWSADGESIAATVFGDSRRVYRGRRGGALAPVTDGTDDLSVCAFDGALRRALCAAQTVNSPPRLVSVDVDGGRVHSGHELNRQLRNVRIMTPEPARWVNRYGTTGTGYRIVPPACRSHGGCPVVVITHGGDARNRFMYVGSEWNYPSQVFAASGFVVLLVNEGKYPVTGVPWEEQRLRLGLDAVAIMEAAVDDAAAAGHADAARAGIMGYSHGFQTGALAIAHSRTFRAASLANGGDGPAAYWGVGSKDLRDYWSTRYGGSPVAPGAAERWRELDPAQNAYRIDAALLMQFDDAEAATGLELYSYLRDQQKPVELRIFPAETHVFHQPATRAAAMEQNLAWFERWLR